MVLREMPEFIYYQCPICDDVTDHMILKGRMGKDNITGTFRCEECGRVFSESIKIPRQFMVKVMFSDGDITETTETQMESDEIVMVGDEFYLDDGRRVVVTYMDVENGSRVKKCQADKIMKLWVKQFDVLNVKVSVNDNRKTYSLRVEADPDDEFSVGMILSFEEFDCVVHAIKTKTRLVRRGSAEAREITRIYGKIRRKTYDVLDFEDEDFEFNEEDYEIDDEDDQ